MGKIRRTLVALPSLFFIGTNRLFLSSQLVASLLRLLPHEGTQRKQQLVILLQVRLLQLLPLLLHLRVVYGETLASVPPLLLIKRQ